MQEKTDEITLNQYNAIIKQNRNLQYSLRQASKSISALQAENENLRKEIITDADNVKELEKTRVKQLEEISVLKFKLKIATDALDYIDNKDVANTCVTRQKSIANRALFKINQIKTTAEKDNDIEELKKELQELKSIPLTPFDFDIVMRIEEIEKELKNADV